MVPADRKKLVSLTEDTIPVLVDWMLDATKTITDAHDKRTLKKDVELLREEKAQVETSLRAVRSEHLGYCKGLRELKAKMERRSAALDERELKIQGMKEAVDVIIDRHFGPPPTQGSAS